MLFVSKDVAEWKRYICRFNLRSVTGNELLIFLLIFVFAAFFYTFNIGFSDLRIDAGVSLMPSVQSTVSYGLTDKYAIDAPRGKPRGTFSSPKAIID